MSIPAIGGFVRILGFGGFNGPSGPGGIISIVTTVYQLALRFFSLGSSGALIGFGVMELSDFALYCYRKVFPKNGRSTVQDVAETVFASIKKVQNIFTEYSFIHGSLYASSGFFSGIAAVHDLGWLNLGVVVPFARFLGSGLFLFLNLYALRQNIRLFREAMEMSKNPDSDVQAFSHRLQMSSVLGMINNIGYILAIVFSLFPPTLALSIALAVFSIFVGSLKIIYDFLVIGPEFRELKNKL